jgi:hypothetical protein
VPYITCPSNHFQPSDLDEEFVGLIRLQTPCVGKLKSSIPWRAAHHIQALAFAVFASANFDLLNDNSIDVPEFSKCSFSSFTQKNRLWVFREGFQEQKKLAILRDPRPADYHELGTLLHDAVHLYSTGDDLQAPLPQINSFQLWKLFGTKDSHYLV